MIETLAAIGLAAGFVLLIVLIAGPGDGQPALTSVLTSVTLPPRPRGVQEMDLAPFAFADSRPVAAGAAHGRAIDGRMEPARAA